MDSPAPRLVLASPSTFRGGCEEYSLTIASAARERGYRVVAALPFRTETQTLIEDFRSRRIEYRPLEIAEDPEAARSSVSRHGSRLVRSLTLLARVRPSVVLLALPWPTYGFGTIVACRLLRIPLAVVFQLAALPFAFSRAKLDIYRWARRGPQQWVAVSEHNRTILQQSFRLNPEDIRLVRNAARMPPTEAVADPSGLERVRADVRRELGYDDRDLILLTVGRLHAQKGYLDLISAIPHIVAERPNVRFVWVGEGPHRPEIEAKLRESGVQGRVRLMGDRTDVPRFLTAADIFVLPTHFEGQPFSVCEAMMAELPVVVSDASGIPEIITSGVTGLLFRTADREDLLEKLRWALRHPSEMRQMAERARAGLSEHDESRMVDQTLALLDELRAARRSPGADT